MGKHTDSVPDMFGPYTRALWDEFARRHLAGDFEQPISAAAFDNGVPYKGGVDFAQAEDRMAVYLFGSRAGKSFTQRTGNTRMTTAEKIKVMQAQMDGAAIQIRPRRRADLKWEIFPGTPDWNWSKMEYRIKPELLRRWFIRIDDLIGYASKAEAEVVAHSIGGSVVEMMEVLP